VADGQRVQVAGVDAKVPNGEWATLSIVARGPFYEIALNDKKLFDYTDRQPSIVGRAGVCTKADSVTHFQWIEAESLL
jgi:hypothetical protein